MFFSCLVSLAYPDYLLQSTRQCLLSLSGQATSEPHQRKAHVLILIFHRDITKYQGSVMTSSTGSLATASLATQLAPSVIAPLLSASHWYQSYPLLHSSLQLAFQSTLVVHTAGISKITQTRLLMCSEATTYTQVGQLCK